MRDYQSNNRGKLIDWLKIDSWIDSGLYDVYNRIKASYTSFSTFMYRFRVGGFFFKGAAGLFQSQFDVS